MKTVNEVSKSAGVSVRTLHHYDAIGLLKPAQVSTAGYRLYDDAALERLQTILLFRELQFPLREIKAIIEKPNFDRKEALKQQTELLKLQRKRLDELIALARDIMAGVNNMNFSAFDKSEIERYTAEAKAKWGETAAYKEYEQKSVNRSADGEAALGADLMQIFKEIGKVKDSSPGDDRVQALIKKLRQFITDNYYTCTPQILSGLGQMYAGDERFKNNIDKAGGIGTAEFASKAIEIYCNQKISE